MLHRNKVIYKALFFVVICTICLVAAMADVRSLFNEFFEDFFEGGGGCETNERQMFDVGPAKVDLTPHHSVACECCCRSTEVTVKKIVDQLKSLSDECNVLLSTLKNCRPTVETPLKSSTRLLKKKKRKTRTNSANCKKK